MKRFSWKTLPRPVIALAPMANISTYPLRSLAREQGADMTFTPMFSSDAIIRNTEKTLSFIHVVPEEYPAIVQIFGYSGELIAHAAQIVMEHLKPAGIDINMGCPAPKITGNECGSALLKEPEKAIHIMREVREKFSGELSVKFRLGWDDVVVEQLAQEAEKIGIDAISIHGRTALQRYSGAADFEPIFRVAQSLHIPVIGNGDIATPEDAARRLQSGTLAGIMIGRAALGNPWVFRDIKAGHHVPVTADELVAAIRTHLSRAIELDGERRAVLEMRKHLCYYFRKHGYRTLCPDAVRVSSKTDIENILRKCHTKVASHA